MGSVTNTNDNDDSALAGLEEGMSEQELLRQLWTFSSSAENDANHHDPTTTTTPDRMNSSWNRMADRMVQEFPTNGRSSTFEETFWDGLVTQTSRMGLHLSSQCHPHPTSSASPSSSSSSWPAAFSTPSGTKFREAATALLHISNQRVVSLTLAALSSLQSHDNHTTTTTVTTSQDLSSLLGTRPLLELVSEHYFAQRLQRLQLVTECLRIEQQQQQQSSENNHVLLQGCTSFLSQMDALVTIQNSSTTATTTTTTHKETRGLLCMLLTVACDANRPRFTRHDLLPAAQLVDSSTSSSSSLAENNGASSASSSWERFAERAMERQQTHFMEERQEAMEALVMLCYSRLVTHRSDLCLIVLALQQMSFFATSTTKGHMDDATTRLAHLAGLLCAECMSLSLPITNGTEDGSRPMPHVFFSGHNVQLELSILRELLTELVPQVLQRRDQYYKQQQLKMSASRIKDTEKEDGLAGVVAPESLALLSFGLLLRLASLSTSLSISRSHENDNDGDNEDDIRESWKNEGMECARLANDVCGAFAYLHHAMDALLPSTSRTKQHVTVALGEEDPQDWQQAAAAQLSNPSEEVVVSSDAASVAYASIGYEVLASTIAVLLPSGTDNDSSISNIGMLCHLCASICRNNPVLCEQFWADWDLFCRSDNDHDEPQSQQQQQQPVCGLLYTAHSLAGRALDMAQQQNGIVPIQLDAVAPLLTLVSSLCYNSTVVDAILKNILPSSLLSACMRACTEVTTNNNANPNSVRAILSSLRTLSTMGGSSSSGMIRQSLEQDHSAMLTNNTVVIDGPRLLYLVAIRFPNAKADALAILSDLLTTIPSSSGNDSIPWILAACQSCGCSQTAASSGMGCFSSLLFSPEDTTATLVAAVHVVQALSTHLCRISFSSKVEDRDMAAFIETTVSGVMSSCNLLALSFSSQRRNRLSKMDLQLAHTVMRALHTTLVSLKPIVKLHRSHVVRELAQNALHVILQTLSTSTDLGLAIAACATLPVTHGLHLAMERFARDRVYLDATTRTTSTHADGGKRRKYGAWEHVVQDPVGGEANMAQSCGAYAQHLSKRLHMVELLSPGDRFLGNQQDDDGDESFALVWQLVKSSLGVIMAWAVGAEDYVRDQHGYSVADFIVEGGPQQQHSSPNMERALSDLRNLSPFRLLLSLALPPPGTEKGSVVWPRDGLSYMNLMARYMSCSSSHSSEVVPSATFAADVVTMSLLHARHTCGRGGTVGVVTEDFMLRALGDGVQLHHATKNALEAARSASQDGEAYATVKHSRLSLALRMLHLLKVSLETYPQVAAIILLGDLQTKDTGLVHALTDSVGQMAQFMKRGQDHCIKQMEQDSERTMQLRLASGCINVLSSLWEVTRQGCRLDDNNDNADLLAHPCNSAVRSVLDANANDFLGDIFTIVTLHEYLLPGLDERRDETMLLSSGTTSRTSVSLNIMSKALNILSVEMLVVMTRKNMDKTSTQIKEFVQRTMDSDAVVGWTSTFASYSGVSYSCDAWKACLDTLRNCQTASFDTLGPQDIATSFPLSSRSNETDGVAGATPYDSWCDVSKATRFVGIVSESKSDIGGSDISMLNLAAVLRCRQLSLISSWKKFSQLHSIVHCSKVLKNPNTAGAGDVSRALIGTNDERLKLAEGHLSAAKSTLHALCRNAAAAFLVKVSYSNSTSIVSSSIESGNMALSLSEVLLHYLHSYVDCASLEDHNIEMLVEMLMKLHEASDRLFAITQLPLLLTHSNDDAHDELCSQKIGCDLRLKLMICAKVLLSMTNGKYLSTPLLASSPSAQRTLKQYNEVRVGFAGLAFDTLGLLKLKGKGINTVPDDSHYGYDFEHGDARVDMIQAKESEGIYYMGRELLRACLSVVVELAPRDSTEPPPPVQYFSSSYGKELCMSLMDRNAVPTLSRHLKSAATVAAESYDAVFSAQIDLKGVGLTTDGVRVTKLTHEHAIDAVQGIIDVLCLLADASTFSSDLLKMMMNDALFRLMTDNPLLHHASKRWLSRRQVISSDNQEPSTSTSQPRYHLRGYLPLGTRYLSNEVSKKGNAVKSSTYRDDPVHGIWRAVIHIFATVLRSSRILVESSSKYNLGISPQQINHKFANAAIDFLSHHKNSLMSCLLSCTSYGSPLPDETSSGQILSGFFGASMSASSKLGSSLCFTPNNLKEAAEILTLVSELCTGVNKNQFQRSNPELVDQMVKMSLDISGAISSFLGASGTAREVFTALSKLSNVLDDEASGVEVDATMNSTFFDQHPLLADGIPNAKHEAIRNAYYASSCCICMTSSDCALSVSSSRKGSNTLKSENATQSLEQTFQIHINNCFTVLMERVAGQCLLRALSVLTKTHPSATLCVYFSKDEAASLTSVALVQPGMTISIRPPGDEFAGPVRFAKALRTNTVYRTMDIEYLDSALQMNGSDVEQNVSISRLAGVEDLSKKACTLEYLPAPKTVTESNKNPALTALSVGHLILALRWCRQQAADSLEEKNAVTPLVQCLAETLSMLMSTELVLYRERGDNSKGVSDISKKVNGQVLDLYEAISDSSESDTPSSSHTNFSPTALGRPSNVNVFESFMDIDVWKMVVARLEHELVSAKRDREQKRMQYEQQPGGVYGSFRGSGRRSPFRSAFPFR